MAIVLLVALAAPAQWVECQSGTNVRLRGVSVADERIAWAVGADGTILRTEDAGMTWHIPVKGAAGVDFRDVEAINRTTACVLAVGEGNLSRIYRTTDAGKTWTLRYTNPDPNGFLDAMAFFDRQNGLALGDPVDGRFVILATEDGGSTWRKLNTRGPTFPSKLAKPGSKTAAAKKSTQPATPKANRPLPTVKVDPVMPLALDGESAFAASGTCLGVSDTGWAWFVTTKGRVFRSEERGRGWTVCETPVRPTNDSSGLFSVAFLDRWNGVATGGDHKKPEASDGPSRIVSSDGGRTWREPTAKSLPPGLRSGLAWIRPGYVPGGSGAGTLVAVGPDGVERSDDAGETWAPMTTVPGQGFHAVAFDPSGRFGVAVGENGRIARWSPSP
jgi:photosystem II stability/assembly factor-like uncharacterized protein